MVKLKDFIKKLQDLVEKYPQFSELPVIYSSDDEGNSFHTVNMTAAPLQIEDIEENYLEVTGWFLGDVEDSISIEDVNAILIN